MLLLVQSIKARKPGKYFSTSSAGVFSLFVLCIPSVELIYILLPSFQSFEYLYKCCSDQDQRENQLKCKLCKDDSTLKALEIYLLNQV